MNQVSTKLSSTFYFIIVLLSVACDDEKTTSQAGTEIEEDQFMAGEMNDASMLCPNAFRCNEDGIRERCSSSIFARSLPDRNRMLRRR